MSRIHFNKSFEMSFMTGKEWPSAMRTAFIFSTDESFTFRLFRLAINVESGSSLLPSDVIMVEISSHSSAKQLLNSDNRTDIIRRACSRRHSSDESVLPSIGDGARFDMIIPNPKIDPKQRLSSNIDCSIVSIKPSTRESVFGQSLAATKQRHNACVSSELKRWLS